MNSNNQGNSQKSFEELKIDKFDSENTSGIKIQKELQMEKVLAGLDLSLKKPLGK